MYKKGVLTIKDWQNGMVKHPIYGFGALKNVEVFENPGIAKLKNRTLDSGITVTGLPSAEVYDIYGNTYTLEGETGLSSGIAYKNGTSIQAGLNNPWDMKIYKDYLWVSNSSVLHCYGPLNDAPQWFGNISTGFASNSSGVLLVGQDDYLYRGNGNSIAKIEVTASGVVGVTPTLSVTGEALDLPDGQYATCMTEYGTNIVIGTCGTNSYSTRNNLPTARLYSWNRQLGTLGNPGLADLPVVFEENGVNAIIQHANKLYVSAGDQGNVYLSDATNYIKVVTLPYIKTGIFRAAKVFFNALSISSQGNLLIGVSGEQDEFTKMGIYEIDISKETYPVSYRKPSSDGTGNNLKIGFINKKSYQNLRVGWLDGSNYGVDTTDHVMYSSYGGVIESELTQVGTFDNKKTFQRIEFSLSTPLVSGQNIRISYRLNDTEDYTIINTWGFSTLGSVLSWGDDAPIADAEYIQLKIELDQDVSAIYGSNINLIQVTLK